MSFQVNLNSVDISARIVSGPVVHKNDVLHGKISPNECSFDIDNTNLAYTIANLDIEGQLVEVWIDSVKQFTGYAEKPTLTRNGRTVHVQAFDKMKQLQKLKCQDKMFIGSTADAILTWLVETCGGISSASYNLDSIVVATGVGTTQAIVGYALYSIKDKLTDRLQEIVDSCGGSMWFDESGVLQFRAGFAATWSTSTVGTITVSKLKDIDSLQWLPSEGDRVIVKSKNRSVKTEKEPIFTWSGTVPPEGLPTGKDENGNAITDDQWRAKFDSPAIDVDDYATVNAAKEFDSGLTLNQTVYDANFDTGVLKYPDFMYLQIDNSAGTDKNVTKLVIEGRPIVENYLEVIYDAGSFNTEREVSNDLISSKVWASSLAKWLYENGNGKFEAVVPLADFSLGLGWKVGDKVEIVDASTGLSHRAWVRAIDIDYRNRDLTVTLRSDRDSEFEYTPPPGSITGPGTNIPYEPAFGDGSAPATPTGLALSTFFSDGKTYVKATWSANTETDIKGYEVAWSYDGSNWYNSGLTSETSLVIEVKAGVTVYVKVKAKDIEGFESSWTSSQSITSAQDTTIPANLTSISAAGGFDIVYVYWNHSKPSDFSHYVVQRAPSPYSSWVEIAVVQSKEFIDKNVVAGTYYKYRVKAYDIYGNAATNWVATTSGVTCSSISSELSDLETQLSGLDSDLTALETELSNLQFADIGGTITEVQIGDDTISAPKLKANSVEASKILAGAVTTEKLYALAVTAEKIAASAVVSDKIYAGAITAEKIATDAVTANKILAGSVTANKLEATLDLSVGRKVVVGSNVQIGKEVGPAGLTGDGIYVSENGYFRIHSGLFMDEGPEGVPLPELEMVGQPAARRGRHPPARHGRPGRPNLRRLHPHGIPPRPDGAPAGLRLGHGVPQGDDGPQRPPPGGPGPLRRASEQDRQARPVDRGEAQHLHGLPQALQGHQRRRATRGGGRHVLHQRPQHEEPGRKPVLRRLLLQELGIRHGAPGLRQKRTRPCHSLPSPVACRLSSDLVHQDVRAPDGLRDAVATRAPKYDLHRPLVADPVAGGDEDRLDAVLRPHDGADHPAVVHQRRALPPTRAGLLERARQPRLGAPHGRHVQDEPQVGRQAEAPGVGNALSVEEGHVRPPPQLREGPKQGRALAEGEKAGDVGKGGPSAVRGLFQHVQAFGVQEHDGREDPVVALRARDVGPRHGPDVPGQPVFQDQPSAQLLLDGRRRPVVHVPGMQVLYLHCAPGVRFFKGGQKGPDAGRPFRQRVRGYEGEKFGEAESLTSANGLSNVLTLSPSHLLRSEGCAPNAGPLELEGHVAAGPQDPHLPVCVPDDAAAVLHDLVHGPVGPVLVDVEQGELPDPGVHGQAQGVEVGGVPPAPVPAVFLAGEFGIVHEQVGAGAEPQVVLVGEAAGVGEAQFVVRQEDEPFAVLDERIALAPAGVADVDGVDRDRVDLEPFETSL